MMDTIEEDNFYCFTEIILKNYFGKKTGNIKSVARVYRSSQGFVACHHCSRTLRADKYSCVFHWRMSFEGIMLTLPIEVVSAFLKKDVINMCQTGIDTLQKNCCS